MHANPSVSLTGFTYCSLARRLLIMAYDTLILLGLLILATASLFVPIRIAHPLVMLLFLVLLETVLIARPSYVEGRTLVSPEYRGYGDTTLEALQDHLKELLGKHEMPRALDIRDALPRTPVGKLSKIELKREEAERAKAAAKDDSKGEN